MKNSFGAKITRPGRNTDLQSYFISLKSNSSPERLKLDLIKIKNLPVQIMMVDPNLKFILLVTTEPIVEQIRTFSTTNTAGAVNIDFDRFRSMVDGSVIKQKPKKK